MSSFGESLKRERELREISLREIADATKISIRYLEALEQNRFGVLPGGLFNKGFIRAYANFIGADGDALVDRYLNEMAARDLAAPGASDIGRQGPERLHRPSETPKRRAVSGGDAPRPADPVVEPRPGAPPAPAAPAAPDLTLAKLAAAIEERRAMERSAGGYGRQRPLAVAGSVLGGAALIFALLLVARAVTTNRSPVAQTRGEAEGPVQPPETAAAAPADPSTDDASVSDPSAAPPPSVDVAPSGTSLPAADPAPDQMAARAPMRASDPALVAPVPAAPPVPSPRSDRRAETPAAPFRAPAPIPSPPPPAESAGMARHDATPARATALSPMDLRLEANSPALVQVSCDGEDRLNRPLLPGEMATMRCFNLIRVSATDAGALRLVVNGRRCAALGEPGSRVQGFAIRSDDVDSICPSRGGTSDANR